MGSVVPLHSRHPASEIRHAANIIASVKQGIKDAKVPGYAHERAGDGLVDCLPILAAFQNSPLKPVRSLSRLGNLALM